MKGYVADHPDGKVFVVCDPRPIDGKQKVQPTNLHEDWWVEPSTLSNFRRPTQQDCADFNLTDEFWPKED